MKTKSNKSKYSNDKIYLSYNQITKDYDVTILTEGEYNQLNENEQKEARFMILKKKDKTVPPPPPQPPAWFKYWREHEFKPTIVELKDRISNIENRLDNIENRLDNVENRLDNIIKKNKLKE